MINKIKMHNVSALGLPLADFSALFTLLYTILRILKLLQILYM